MQCKGTSPRPTPPTPPSTTSTQPEHDLAALNLLETVTTTNTTATTTHDQSIDSQLSEEMLYQQELLKQSDYEPYIDEIARFGLRKHIAMESNVFENRDSSPDSPPSQTSTILIRPLLDSTPPNSGASLTSLNQEILTHGPAGACKSCKQKKKIPEIPHFMDIQFVFKLDTNTKIARFNGPLQLPLPPTVNCYAIIFIASTASTNTTVIIIIHQRPQTNSNQPAIAKLPEIPPFRARKISAESTTHLNLRELKSNTDTMDILKPAPSWSNVAIKSQQQQQQQVTATSTSTLQAQQQQATPPSTTSQYLVASSSSSSGGGVSVSGLSNTKAEATTSRPSVGGISNSSTSSLQHQQQQQQQQANDKDQAQQQQKSTKSTKVLQHPVVQMMKLKSRLKQKLVKSARSVAIFSLKLKERRQREAEKAAAIAVEHAKALAKLPPVPLQSGGELSLIPIEQLIKIEDIKPALRSPPPTTTTTASTSFLTTSSMSSALTLANTSTTPSSSALLAAAAAHLQQQQQQHGSSSVSF
ncbi:hypothetical protein DOY81_008406 [Sarcophaga bullata]|nr:hypothetical protein DOY81_008406 [Sarcophaga bullata]